jgi:hypothetical protein
MKFDLLLEELLNELSGEEIYKKYYSKIPYDDFLTIVSADPQSLVEGNMIKKMGKYSKLLLSIYQMGNLPMEDLETATEYLEYVYQYKVALDLNKVKELGDIYNVIKDYVVKERKNLDELLKVLSRDEYKILHDGKIWFIFQPLTEKAACYLGVNAEWCTTWGPYSLNKKHKSRGNLFGRYSSDGPIYTLIDKNDFDNKYQIHFETNQFMDKTNRRINTAEFLSDPKNNEILYYFFPSLSNNVSAEQLKLEVKRIDILPEEWGLKILEKAIGQVNNKLINAILSKDTNLLSEIVYDPDIIEFEDGRVKFTLDGLSSDLDELKSNISWYEYETDNGWDFIYDDMRDRGMDEYEEEKLKEFLKDFYNEHSERFKETFGVNDYDVFINTFYNEYLTNDQYDITDAFWSDIADLSYRDYEEMNERHVDNIKKDIDINSGYNRDNEITVSSVKFIQFLLKKDIQNILNEENLYSILDDYIDYCGHGGEFERLYDYNIKYPKYGVNNSLTDKTNSYFEYILDNAEEHNQCIGLRKKLNAIIEKYFKTSTKYENNHIIVRLKSMKINCEKGTVQIEYLNKDTGEKYGGWNEPDGVKIDNLVSLLTNYKLFESYTRFKKNIY